MSTFTRLHKETKLYKPDAIAEGIEDASSTAIDYVTEISSGSGIEVHPRDDEHNKVQITPNGMEVFQNDASVAAYGSTSRIGKVGDVHVIVDQDSLDVMDGADTLATFGEETRIGKEDESHLELDYHSMQLISQENNHSDTYFHVSDLRERSGTFSRTDRLDTDISDAISSFDLAIPASEITSVKFGYTSSEEDVDPSGYSVHRSSTAPYDGYITSLTFSPPLSLLEGEPDPESLTPAVMVSLVVTYASDIPARVLTFGSRTGNVGPYSSALGQSNVASGHTSHARGYACEASGQYSCADGYDSKATGYASHAFGSRARATGRSSFAEGENTTAEGYQSHAQNYGTLASAAAQTAIGMYNMRDNGVEDDTITDTFTGDGVTRVFTPSQYVAYTRGVYIDGVATGDYSMTSDYKSFQFLTAPANGAVVRIEYVTTTLPVGYPGYGRYAFMVGNGADPSRRSNAFAVQWDGVTEHYGDVPWTNLTLASGAIAHASERTPKIRKWGPVVTITGAAKPTAEVAADGTLTIGTVPDGCIPKTDVVSLQQGSGKAVWMLRIDTSGEVTASRYRVGSDSAAMTASGNGTWLPLNVTYMV
jgi:hypothetical protein